MIDWDAVVNATLVVGGTLVITAIICLLVMWSPWAALGFVLVSVWGVLYHGFRRDSW